MLRALIASLAQAHGTLPFEPHLTVCGAGDPSCWDAVADYVGNCGLLPLSLAQRGISCSIATPFRAVVIDLENRPALEEFRAGLRRITGAGEPAPPHISLLYPFVADSLLADWATDADRLRRIGAGCAARLDMPEFLLDRAEIVMPDRDWANITSWQVMRVLSV